MLEANGIKVQMKVVGNTKIEKPVVTKQLTCVWKEEDENRTNM
jgi:hypothetical protein